MSVKCKWLIRIWLCRLNVIGKSGLIKKFNSPTKNTNFPLSKWESFHQIFTKLGESVGDHDNSASFNNQPHRQRHLNYDQISIVRSLKSRSFHAIFTKLDENVCGHTIAAMLDNQPHRHELSPLNYRQVSLVCSLSRGVSICPLE